MTRIFRILGLAMLGLILPTSVAATIVTSHLGSDEELQGMLPEESVAFIAEGRIGDGGSGEVYELGLGQNTTAPDVTAQYAWETSATEEFTLSYDKVLNEARLVLGGNTLSYSPDLLFVEIFLRAAAVGENTSVSISGLYLGGESVADSCVATGADGLDILRISGAALLDGFTLTGEVTMTWSGSPPTGDQLSFQARVGSPDPLVATDTKTWGWIKSRYR